MCFFLQLKVFACSGINHNGDGANYKLPKIIVVAFEMITEHLPGESEGISQGSHVSLKVVESTGFFSGILFFEST